MVDYVIFGFGLFVTLVVGFGLTTMITIHNRAIESDLGESEIRPEPVKVTASHGKSN